MSKNNEERKPPQATVELRSIAGLTEYDLDIISLPPERVMTMSLVCLLHVQQAW